MTNRPGGFRRRFVICHWSLVIFKKPGSAETLENRKDRPRSLPTGIIPAVAYANLPSCILRSAPAVRSHCGPAAAGAEAGPATGPSGPRSRLHGGVEIVRRGAARD